MRATVTPSSAIPLGRAAAVVLGGSIVSRRVPQAASPAYLKALRQAELAAWNARGGRIEAAAEPLRRARAELAVQRRREAWLFAAVAAAAAVAVTIGLSVSLPFADHLADFADLIRRLIG